MPLSTSNSDSAQWPKTYWRRPIPTAHWRGVALLTLLLVVGFMVCWETYWRLEGYEPSYEETKDLWAANRAKVGQGADAFVLIGSSRTNFDIDLDMWEQDWGGRRPVMLAKPGTSPRAYLTDLANDPEFRGTVVCGVTPVLFFAPDFLPPVASAQEDVDYAKRWSPAQKSGMLLSIPLESAFASLNAEDLSLAQLLHRKVLPLPDRMSPVLPPPFPPYFARVDRERRNHMWWKMEKDPELQHRVQQIWLPHWEHTPTLEGEGLDGLLARIKSEVAQIQARGGAVVFVSLPVSGALVEIENRRWPRALYWDRLLAETGAKGVHCADYESLSGFECPEWSHLSRSDAVLFTHALYPILDDVIE